MLCLIFWPKVLLYFSEAILGSKVKPYWAFTKKVRCERSKDYWSVRSNQSTPTTTCICLSLCSEPVVSQQHSSSGVERTAAGQTVFSSLTDTRHLVEHRVYVSCMTIIQEEISIVFIYQFTDFICLPIVAGRGNMLTVKLETSYWDWVRCG